MSPPHSFCHCSHPIFLRTDLMTDREAAKSLQECRHDRHEVSNLFSLVGKYNTRELLVRMNKLHSSGKKNSTVMKKRSEKACGLEESPLGYLYVSSHHSSQGHHGSILEDRIHLKLPSRSLSNWRFYSLLYTIDSWSPCLSHPCS